MKPVRASIVLAISLCCSGEALARCKFQYSIFHPCDGCTVEQRAVITNGSACRTSWGPWAQQVEMVASPRKGTFEFTPSRLQSTYQPFPGAKGDDVVEFVGTAKAPFGPVKARFKTYFSIQ